MWVAAHSRTKWPRPCALSYPIDRVKAVLINIFGGITRCDQVATGILEAISTLTVKVPFVVRLVGTNEEEGRRILAEANLITATSLADAAQKAVAAAQVKQPDTASTAVEQNKDAATGTASQQNKEKGRCMSILVNKDTRLVVQGITGREGAFHTQQMIEYGTKVVAGVTPGKGGEWAVGNVPVFDTVQEAVNATGANTSIIYVPARFAPEAIIEAADAGIALIVCITENIPALDMVMVRAYLDTLETRLNWPQLPWFDHAW